MKVRCKGGKCYQKQGVEKVSNSNTNLWMKFEDKNLYIYVKTYKKYLFFVGLNIMQK